jgi:hypothetical protein
VRTPDPQLLLFLSAYDKSVQDLALAMREIMIEEARSAIETIYDAYSAVAMGYSFTGRLKDQFCHLAVYTGHVNLGFDRGVDLPDPRNVLEGTGKTTRHIRIEPGDDITQPWLRRYVRMAIAQVGGPLAPGREGSTVVKPVYKKKRRPKRQQ